jgi:hypothetical protein
MIVIPATQEIYKQALKEVMCSTPPWWREKYLANSELSTMKEGK